MINEILRLKEDIIIFCNKNKFENQPKEHRYQGNILFANVWNVRFKE